MWNSIETLPKNRPVLVKLEKELFRSKIHTYSPMGKLGCVCGRFDYDAPKIIAWCELPKE